MPTTEAALQAEIRLVASRDYGAPLWRNNSGAMREITGRLVRFGLGNESKRINDAWKSADLIGITPVRGVGIFTAIEVKAPGWKLTAGDKRARAQANFINAVRNMGGIAGFCQSVDDYRKLILDFIGNNS